MLHPIAQTALLAAGIGDIISAILPFIVLIIWVISQFVGGDNNKNRPRPQRKREDEVSDEKLREQIEGFLREAGVDADEAQPEQQQADQPQEAEADYAVVVPPPEAAEHRSRLSDYESVSPGHAAGETVSEHVTEHITPHRFDLDDHIGEEIEQTDERLEAHLHQQFDHALGRLGKPLSVASSPVADRNVIAPSMADEIFDLVRNPHDVRRAIVFNEIMTRPKRLE